MQSTDMLATKPQLNPGELDVLLPVFQEYEVVVPTDLVRVPMVICVVGEECLHQPKPGEDGTGQSTKTKEDMLCVLHWLLVLCLHWLWLVVIRLKEFQKFQLFAPMPLKV